MTQPLRDQNFQQVLGATAAASYPGWSANFIGWCGRPNSVAVCTTLALVGSIVILLCLSPPFVRRDIRDTRRPWVARSDISWLSVFIVSIIACSVSLMLPSAFAWGEQGIPL